MSESEAGSGTTGVPNWPVALAEKSLRRPVVPLMVSGVLMSSRLKERLPPGMGVPMAWPRLVLRASAMMPPSIATRSISAARVCRAS